MVGLMDIGSGSCYDIVTRVSGANCIDFAILTESLWCAGSKSGANGQPGSGQSQAVGPARPGHNLYQGSYASCQNHAN
jgi:hypothetical protein